MSQEDDARLQHILKSTEARQKAEDEKARAAQEHAAAQQRRRQEAAPKIASLIDLIKNTANLVNSELASTGTRIEVTGNRYHGGSADVVISAAAPESGRQTTPINLKISDMGYVSGAEFFTNQQHRNVEPEEFTQAMLRSGYLKLAETALGIRPYK